MRGAGTSRRRADRRRRLTGAGRALGGRQRRRILAGSPPGTEWEGCPQQGVKQVQVQKWNCGDSRWLVCGCAASVCVWLVCAIG